MAEPYDYNVCVKRSITIGRDRGELFRAWREPGMTLAYLSGQGSVDVLDENRSRLGRMLPGMSCGAAESHILSERENEAIAWRTTGDGKCTYTGVVRFKTAPAGLGTEVSLEIGSRLPGGQAMGALAALFGRSPEEFVSRTLHNFKQLAETGEVASNRGPKGKANLMARPKNAPLLLAGAAVVLLSAFLLSRWGGRREEMLADWEHDRDFDRRYGRPLGQEPRRATGDLDRGREAVWKYGRAVRGMAEPGTDRMADRSEERPMDRTTARDRDSMEYGHMYGRPSGGRHGAQAGMTMGGGI